MDIRTNDQMEWMQEAIYFGLLSCDLFAPLNIILEKKMRLDKQVQLDTIVLQPRNNCAGAGLLVEMPKLVVEKPNSQVNLLITGMVVFEERNLNGSDAGTGKSAEQWAQLAVEFARGWIIGQAGGLVVEPSAIESAHDRVEPDSGIIAYRGSVSQRVARPNYKRVIGPTLAPVGGANWNFVPNPANLDATVYYTLDGSMPRSVPDDSGAVAKQWVGAPFAAPSGTLVQWIALSPGQLPSHVGSQIIS